MKLSNNVIPAKAGIQKFWIPHQVRDDTKVDLQYFVSKNLAFALIKGGKVLYRSKNRGLKPLIFCLKKYRTQMRGATVYDKVIGRAAALLLTYAKVGQVMTPLISRGGLIILKRGGAKIQYQKIVKNILNRAGDDLCPMEKMSRQKTTAEFVKSMLSWYVINMTNLNTKI